MGIVLNMRSPKVNFKILRNVLVFSFVVAISFSVGYFYGFKGYIANTKKFPIVTISRELPVDKKELNFSLFWRVWDTVHAKYYDKDKVIDSELVYGAIRGMVSAIGDPYTIF